VRIGGTQRHRKGKWQSNAKKGAEQQSKKKNLPDKEGCEHSAITKGGSKKNKNRGQKM